MSDDKQTTPMSFSGTTGQNCLDLLKKIVSRLQSQNRVTFGGHLCEKTGGLNIGGRELAWHSFDCKLNVDLKNGMFLSF